MTQIKLVGHIGNIFDSETKGNFEKRVFWLKEIPREGKEKYASTWQLELQGAKCVELNGYKIGDKVECSIDIIGRSWVNKQGVESVFTALKCWEIKGDASASGSKKTSDRSKSEESERGYFETSHSAGEDLPL